MDRSDQNTTVDTPVLRDSIDLGDGLTAVDVWQSLRAGERAWQSRATPDERLAFHRYTDDSDRQVLASLQDYPVEGWVSLCNGAGWSGICCAALSWCKGSNLHSVLIYWRHLSRWAEPDSAEERAAAFFNPALLPENRLSRLLEVAQDAKGLAVLIAARAELPILDISEADFNRYNLPPVISALIAARQA